MRRTSDTKARLLETAMQLMYVRGYTAVGVQEICARAGVNKGSFYYFFPSKRALGLAVIDAYGQHVRELWEQTMQTDDPLLIRLQRVFERAYEAHYTLFASGGQMYGCPIGNFALELSCQDEALRQRLRETFAGWVKAVEHTLHKAVVTGDLPELDITTLAQTLVAYFEGVLMLAKTQNDPGVVRHLAPGAVHLVEAAVQAWRYGQL